MPLLFILIGLFLLIPAVRGGDNLDKAVKLLKGDFTGPDNFVFWLLAIFAIGAIGYVPKLRPVSTAFLVLLAVGLVLSKAHNGLITQFMSAIKATESKV